MTPEASGTQASVKIDCAPFLPRLGDAVRPMTSVDDVVDRAVFYALQAVEYVAEWPPESRVWLGRTLYGNGAKATGVTTVARGLLSGLEMAEADRDLAVERLLSETHFAQRAKANCPPRSGELAGLLATLA